MGYNTDFSGVLSFTSEMTKPQLAYLKELINSGSLEGCSNMSHIDLMISDDDEGLQWNYSEKSYGMIDQVNGVIKEMRKFWPAFGLSGSMDAQGEEIGDIWVLEINPLTGLAEHKEVPKIGTAVRCPHCQKQFKLEAQKC